MFEGLVLAIVFVAAQISATVQPLSGEAVQGRILQLDTAGATVQVGDQTRTFTSQEFRQVEFPSSASAAAPAIIQVEFTDGSVARVQQYTVSESTATLVLDETNSLTASTDVIRRVLMQNLDSDEAAREKWEALSTEQLGKDILVFRRGTAMSLDSFDGIIRDITPDQVQLTYDGDDINAKRERVIGITYFHPTSESSTEPVVCSVVDQNGSTWRAVKLELKEDQLHWTTASNIQLQLPISNVRQLDYASGNLVYLSDLQPEVEKWEPYVESRVGRELLAARYAPRRDESFEGGPLLLGGKAYSKGLGLHSRTELVYRLTDEYRRFRATAGIDDRVRDAEIAASVRLVISGDDKVLFDQIVSVTGPPVDLDLDVTGARRLRIFVDFGEDLDVADYLNLCEARLTK